ncbi:MAG: Trk system potassium uptake protein TrkG [Candidatus Accumulibacter sp. BA-94]|nr:MAG: Trk system potassium uptake protein TrkG [Candidatus Accumulibacter sp. BA-94]
MAFSIMGLGGFSSKDASLGHFDSLEIELVVIFFALLAGISFSTHFLAFSQRSLRAYRVDIEAHYFLGTLALSILALSFYLWPTDIYPDYPTTLRYVAFHSVSLATSLGFATTRRSASRLPTTCCGPCSGNCGYFSWAASSPARGRPAAASR